MGRPYNAKAGSVETAAITVSTNTQLCPEDKSRTGILVNNISGAPITLSFGTSTAESVTLADDVTYEVPDIASNLRVTASGTGFVVVTEFF